jgi:hypothetical protein
MQQLLPLDDEVCAADGMHLPSVTGPRLTTLTNQCLLLFPPCGWHCICSHLPVLAQALAALNASNLDAMHTPPLTTTTSSSSEPSAAPAAAEHQQQQQQQQSASSTAAAESARALLLELCGAVQGVSPTSQHFGAGQIARFVSAMARLGHYDWQAMRHVCLLAAAHAKVGGTA